MFAASYELRYDKPNSQALVTLEGLSPERNNGAHRVSAQQDQPSIANQPLHVTQLFREDIILRLTDVDQKLEEYIKQLAKKRDCLCLKVETGFDIIGPFGIIDQFRNELLDYSLKMSQGGSTNQPIAPDIEQPVHMRPLSSRSSSGSQKTSSSKHASHTGGPQGLLPPLVDSASRRPVEMERSAVGALVKQEGPLRSKSPPNGDQSAFSSSNSDMDTGSLDKCSICLGPLQSPTQTACGHTFCSKCLDRATAQGTHPLCPMCKTPITQTYQVCPICLSNATDPVTTVCCKQMYCRTCLSDSLKASPYCPTCKRVVRKLMGDQPPGTMAITQYWWSLAGYDGYGTIVIDYYIPDGIQGLEHPNPGTRFHGTTRSAYLPDNAEGREVLALLQKAWEARMVFTVGTSVTTGQSNCVVWNNIHHKTSSSSGPYGYPDATYLKRVKQELASRGITLEDGDAATL